MNESPIGADHDEEMFAIDGHAAQHFLAAHLSVESARISIRYADEGCHDHDPAELLHQARIEAAEAQHHITLTAEQSAKVNAPHVLIGALSPLLRELEQKLDAIRYRAHTPFGENPAWWSDLDLDLSYLPDDDEPFHYEPQTKTIIIQTSPVEDKREPLALVRQDRDATGTDWTVVRADREQP